MTHCVHPPFLNSAAKTQSRIKAYHFGRFGVSGRSGTSSPTSKGSRGSPHRSRADAGASVLPCLRDGRDREDFTCGGSLMARPRGRLGLAASNFRSSRARLDHELIGGAGGTKSNKSLSKYQ